MSKKIGNIDGGDLSIIDLKVNQKINIEGKFFVIKRQSVEPWFTLQEGRI